MKKLINKMTWKGYPGHEPKGESITIPDDTLPLKNILLRYQNGIDVPRGEALFGDVEDDEHESEDYNQVVNADLVDKEEMLKDRIAFIEVIKAKKSEIEEAKNKTRQKAPEPEAE